MYSFLSRLAVERILKIDLIKWRLTMNIPHLKLKNMLKGILAGFIATITLSLVMIIKQAIGFIPELNPIHIITQMINTQVPIIGWIGHFFIGPI